MGVQRETIDQRALGQPALRPVAGLELGQLELGATTVEAIDDEREAVVAEMDRI